MLKLFDKNTLSVSFNHIQQLPDEVKCTPMPAPVPPDLSLIKMVFRGHNFCSSCPFAKLEQQNCEQKLTNYQCTVKWIHKNKRFQISRKMQNLATHCYWCKKSKGYVESKFEHNDSHLRKWFSSSQISAFHLLFDCNTADLNIQWMLVILVVL